jgi:PEP-CTERM motif
LARRSLSRQVDVAGNASLNGTLNILLQGGFNPSVGSTYDFLVFTPGELTGTFSTINNAFFSGGSEKWAVIYNNPGGYVGLTAQANTVPEPSSLLLLGGGLMTRVGILRRKLLL